MGLLSKIGEMIGGAETQDTAYNLFEVSNSQSEVERVKAAQKIWDYYVGDKKEILRYTVQSLARTFSDDDIAEFQIPFINIFQRIINRLSLVYSEPAERYLHVDKEESVVDGKTIKIGDKRQAAQADIYQALLQESNINVAIKRAHRYSKAMDTVHVMPVWRDGHVEYDIFPSHLLTVQESADNYLKASAAMYRQVTGDAFEYVYWDAEKTVRISRDGKPIEEKENIYGVFPFVVLRMRETENYWGEGDTQLVDVNEKINVLLVNTFDNAIMQAHGQPFAINLGSEGTLKTGPRHIIEANNVRSDMVAPSFQFVQPQPAIAEVTMLIDWMVKTVCVQRGLPSFSVSTDVSAQSGAAKSIDSQELYEMRKDDIEILRGFEKQLYETTRVVWNTHNPDQQISEDMQFCIDFEEPGAPESEKDRWAVNLMKLQVGAWSPIEEFVDEDEGVDEAAALKIVRDNLAIRNELNDEYGIMKAFDAAPLMQEQQGQGNESQIA